MNSHQYNQESNIRVFAVALTFLLFIVALVAGLMSHSVLITTIITLVGTTAFFCVFHAMSVAERLAKDDYDSRLPVCDEDVLTG